MGRNWMWALAFGIVSIVAGLVVIFVPGLSLMAIAILFGAQLIINGVFLFGGAFAVARESGWLRALTALLAALSFVVGVYLIRHPMISLLVLAVVLGVFWIFHGFIQLFMAIGRPEVQGRGWTLASGVLGIVAGLIVLFFPAISLLALTIVLGIWLIVYGALMIVSAFGARAEQEVRAGRSGLSPT